MKTFLDPVYTLLGYLAALCMLGVLTIQLLLVLGRHFNFSLMDAPDAYVGYLLAGGSFLAMSVALRKGDHIRVTLILQRIKGATRIYMEILCLAVATFFSGFFAWASVQLVYNSYQFKELSQNLDATPVWIPQMTMAIGMVALFVAFLEEFIYVVRKRELPIGNSDESARTE